MCSACADVANLKYKGVRMFQQIFDQTVKFYSKAPCHFKDRLNMQIEFLQSGMHSPPTKLENYEKNTKGGVGEGGEHFSLTCGELTEGFFMLSWEVRRVRTVYSG